MRSPAEIRFRLRQEAANLFLYWRPPVWRGDNPAPLNLPPLPPFHFTPEIPPTPARWRRDPATGVEAPLHYFRRIPYLDSARAGDHKTIWDTNRHQQLLWLTTQGQHAQVSALLSDWLADNPFHHGMNWTSALEVAFRALSWLYLWHSPGFHPPPGWLDSLHAHGAHLRENLSVYFSPNTHLLGEAVALHALGLFFRRPDWQHLGRQTVLDCLSSQVLPDGAYFEQSTYYHVYALDFFVFHHHLEALPPEAFSQLQKMGIFLATLLGQTGELPLLGDDDGGRLYHPYADYSFFAQDSLARLWPEGPPRPTEMPLQFPNAGLYFLSNGALQILFDAGAFARGSAGHSHADTLNILIRHGEDEILIDPGTYTYTSNPSHRQLFRSTAMHNTISFNGESQAFARGPFRWEAPPRVEVISQSASHIEALCAWRSGFVHRRRLDYTAPRLEITDSLSGPPGEHLVEQFWHFPGEAASQCLHVSPPQGFALQHRPELSVRSRHFGQQEPAFTLALRGRSPLPLKLHSWFDLA